jgi:hypothetical protein
MFLVAPVLQRCILRCFTMLGQAVTNIGMGLYEKTILVFDEPWWQEKADAFFIQRVVKNNTRRGFLADWINAYKV